MSTKKRSRKPKSSAGSKTANRKTTRTPAKQTRKAKAKAQNASTRSIPTQGPGRKTAAPLSRRVKAPARALAFEYDVCLSFAGENRSYVTRVATYLKNTIAYAHGNDAALVEVQSVVMGSIGGKHTCTVMLRSNRRHHDTMEITVNGMTPDQGAEKRARLILLGEPLTAGGGHADDFLLHLLGRVDEHVLEPVLPKLWRSYHAKPVEFLRLARLQAVFALKATHTVEHILAFTLGPIAKSGVQVHFEGRRRQAYTNRSATVLRITGKCPLPVRV